MKRILLAVLLGLCLLLALGTEALADDVVEEDTELDLPAGILVIEEEAFAGSGAEAVYIPDGAKTIGKRAFADCKGLYVIRIPSSVNSIAADAFENSNCDHLTILGTAGSEAYRFAKRNNIMFEHEEDQDILLPEV